MLAAQFESFMHPLVIMLTVPLAVLGALLGLWLTGSTLNLFSQIGIVMLVGLAAKNGILIVEFANQRRDEGLSIIEAILEASATRLRPILMTSIATVTGALPLMFCQRRRARPAGRPSAWWWCSACCCPPSCPCSWCRRSTCCWRRYTHAPEERARMLEGLEARIASVDSSHGG